MFHDQHPDVQVLQQRVEALEARLAKLQTQHSRRASRSGALVPFGITLLPLLAFAGWAIAQQPQAEPLTDLIRKVGGVTQVTAPFQVVDASGRVLLSAAPDLDANAAVSAYLNDGGGAISTNSASGTSLVSLGSRSDGFGGLSVNDSEGKTRSLMVGQGRLAVFNQSGKQVAGVTVTDSQVGRVAVWGAKGVLSEMTEASDGSGLVQVLNARNEQVSELGSDEKGNGVISIVQKGHAAGSLSVNGVGAGILTLANAQGKLGLDALGDHESGGSRGGAIIAYNDGGAGVAALGSTPEGKGVVAIFEQSRLTAELKTNSSGAGDLLLNNAQGKPMLQASGALESDPSTGGGISTFDAAGDVMVALGGSKRGKGVVTLFDKDHTAAELFVNDAGVGALTLNNAEGNSGVEAWGAGTESPGGAVLAFNKANDPVVTLGSSADGIGEITVNEKNHDVAVLTANSAGAGHLYLTNSEGRMGLAANGQAAEGPGGGSVYTFNGAGEGVAAFGTSDKDKGHLTIFDHDRPVAEMTASDKGSGEMVLYRSNGTRSLDADGENSGFRAYNAQETLVAGMGLSKEGKGRIAVYGKQGGLVELSEGASGAGLVQLKNAQDTVVAGMTGAGNAGTVLVKNSAGQTVSEMSVTEGGVGQVVVWGDGGQKPAALLTKAVDGTGGLLQIYNEKVAVANVKVSSRGGGYIELSDPSGMPTVEAGTAPEGYGLVRVGPKYRCAPGGAPAMALGLPDCIMGKQ